MSMICKKKKYFIIIQPNLDPSAYFFMIFYLNTGVAGGKVKFICFCPWVHVKGFCLTVFLKQSTEDFNF